MRFGSKLPTDIDFYLEYENKCKVFGEAKFGGKPLPVGQRLALERLIDDLIKPAVLLVGSHTEEIGDDVDIASAVVTEYYYRGRWRTPARPIIIREAAEMFIRKWAST